MKVDGSREPALVGGGPKRKLFTCIISHYNSKPLLNHILHCDLPVNCHSLILYSVGVDTGLQLWTVNTSTATSLCYQVSFNMICLFYSTNSSFNASPRIFDRAPAFVSNL